MNDHEIDRLLRRLDRTGPRDGLFHRAGQELLEEIMSEACTEMPEDLDAEVVPIGRGRARRRPGRVARWTVGVAAAVALGLAVGVPTAVFRPGGTSTVTAAEQLSQESLVGNGNPHLLMTDPAWQVTEVLETKDLGGEIRFTRGDEQVQITWNDRVSQDVPTNVVRIFGLDADLTTAEPGRFTIALDADRTRIVIDATGPATEEDFLKVLAELRPVPAKQWNASMPSTVVTPDNSVATATRMLADLPKTPGVDAESFRSEGSNDYYNFGWNLTEKVACYWLNDYAEAREQEDESRMAAADEALSTSRDWAVLTAMATEGGWSQAIWAAGDHVAARASVSEDIDTICD